MEARKNADRLRRVDAGVDYHLPALICGVRQEGIVSPNCANSMHNLGLDPACNFMNTTQGVSIASSHTFARHNGIIRFPSNHTIV